jgi:hypothetical protein
MDQHGDLKMNNNGPKNAAKNGNSNEMYLINKIKVPSPNNQQAENSLWMNDQNKRKSSNQNGKQ